MRPSHQSYSLTNFFRALFCLFVDLTRESVKYYKIAESLSNTISSLLFQFLATVGTTSFVLPPILKYIFGFIDREFNYSMPAPLRYVNLYSAYFECTNNKTGIFTVCRSLFDTETSNWNYLLAYILFMLGGYSVAFMFLVTNTFFITSSLHLIAMFRDLRDCFIGIDCVLRS